MSRTPESYKEDYYTRCMIPRGELFGELVGCAKSYPPSRIVAGLDAPLLIQFQEFVMGHAGITRDDEIISSHGKPPYGVAEIKKLIQYFAKHPAPPHQA